MACDEGIHFTKDHRYTPKLILSEKVYINSHYRPALNNLEPKSEPKSEPKPGLSRFSLLTLFRNGRFILNLIPQQNALKFAIFLS